MLNIIKKIIKVLITNFVVLINKTSFGAFMSEQMLSIAMRNTQVVKHGSIQLIFTVPNMLNRFRINTFSIKEPETLEWIDSIPKDSIVWDIGANIGLYSCYAAKARDAKVFAFEPSVFNLELLARNIHLNDLTSKIAIIPLPLSNKLSFDTLNMTTTDWGGALSTFGQDYGWDGLKMKQVFQFQTVGISANDAINFLQLPQPNFIKIDVDGIEHLILSGAESILNKIDGILIEVNDSFNAQADQCKKILLDAGLVLKEKRHSEMFSSSESFGAGKIWNQIWYRKTFDRY